MLNNDYEIIAELLAKVIRYMNVDGRVKDDLISLIQTYSNDCVTT